MKELNSNFIEILESNKDMILRICGAYASDLAEKQDLFQEVTIAIWKSLPSFQSNSSVSTWIYRIALNTCIRLSLRNKKSKMETVKLTSVHLENLYKESHNQEHETQFTKLQSCIQQLQEPDRSIVLLHLEELSHKEIAEIIGISENHVAVKMKRAKVKLLNCMNQDHG
ncbi:RNA polymerase sigma factor [Fulvivirgaceae bacterium LMO-SS25]